MESEENGNVLISSSSALMTLFTSSSFVFDWVISVLRLPQTPWLEKTINRPFAGIHVVQKKKNRNASEQESHWVNDVSLLFVFS